MKTVKVGSVGLGRLGYEHACNLATQVPGCELAAICDVDEKRVREVAEELGVPYTYTDFEEMCKNPELDAIVIVSPSFCTANRLRLPCRTASMCSVKSHSAQMWRSARARRRLSKRIPI